MVICSKCKINKPVTEFYASKRSSNGLMSQCKACHKEYGKTDKAIARIAVYSKSDSARASAKKYRESELGRATRRAYSKAYWYSPKRQEWVKAYRATEAYKIRKRKADKMYRNSIEYKIWWAKNWKKYYDAHREYPAYRINDAMSTAVYLAIKERKGGRSWELLVGYTVQELMAHLENQFEDWMTWENYGEWHIDHIRPKSSFNYTTPEDLEFKKCWALENLQPLRATENIAKGARLEYYPLQRAQAMLGT